MRIVRPETPEDKGTYGVATRRFTYMGYGGSKDYVQALRDIVVTIMIEKPGTVDNLEEVLAVPGVDMVQWGGSDYSMGIGRAGERYSPELRTVERRVFGAVLDAHRAAAELAEDLVASDLRLLFLAHWNFALCTRPRT